MQNNEKITDSGGGNNQHTKQVIHTEVEQQQIFPQIEEESTQVVTPAVKKRKKTPTEDSALRRSERIKKEK
uniref:Uncharacterized protein n=1 Tax=Arundo donax TaxID=35708 RepID=A0A0A8YQJ5_ARUDO